MEEAISASPVLILTVHFQSCAPSRFKWPDNEIVSVL